MVVKQKMWLPISKAERLACYLVPPLACAASYAVTLAQSFVSASDSVTSKYLDMMTTQLAQVNFDLATKIADSGLGPSCTNPQSRIVPDAKTPSLEEVAGFESQSFRRRLPREQLTGEVFFFPDSGETVTAFCQIEGSTRGFRSNLRFYQSIRSLADQDTYLANSTGELLLLPPGPKAAVTSLFEKGFSHYTKAGMRSGSSIITTSGDQGSTVRMLLVFREVPRTNLVLMRLAPYARVTGQVFQDLRHAAFTGLVTVALMTLGWIWLWGSLARQATGGVTAVSTQGRPNQ